MPNNNTTDLNATVHTFEAAGLGKGPFRLSHVTSDGGNCQYCNTAIVFRFYIQGQDSRTFFVGSDCVMKTGDVGLMRIVDREVKARTAALKKARDAEKLNDLRLFLSNPVSIAALTKLPHPNSYYASTGKTMKDYADWMILHSGNTGKLKLAAKLLPKKARKAA
jgi:hypothetical protein